LVRDVELPHGQHAGADRRQGGPGGRQGRRHRPLSGAPLILPILYKTLFYALAAATFRIAELLIRFSFADQGFGAAFRQASGDFTWHHFAAVQIWLFVCFLIYVTASELSAALGPGQLKWLLFHRR
jgi:hypothetical protein